MTSHRQFTLPRIDYGASPKPERPWGWNLTVHVDPTGKVVCYRLAEETDCDRWFTWRRIELIHDVKTWRYAPFMKDGKPVAAVVTERIEEEEVVLRHRPMPRVAADQLYIALERQGCFGECPTYKVEVYGDGRVIYEGSGFVDVLGKHSFRIRLDEVARLVELLRASDIWSMRDSYMAGVTDLPTYVLTLTIGGETHQLLDYAGRMVGMPPVVSEFEAAVDDVARAHLWLNFSGATLDYLKAEQFNFQSADGFALLKRAIDNNDARDDQAILQLLNLTLPIGAERPPLDPAILVLALRNRRTLLVEPLITLGALASNGRLDQNKINAAFLAAIAGGDLASAQRIWEYGAAHNRPSLTFDSAATDDKRKTRHKRVVVPLTLRLSNWTNPRAQTSSLPVIQWLQGLGCDIKAVNAEGDTLLHIATTRRDADLVRYLLAQGLDAAKLGHLGLPALASAHDEAIALALLEAGGDANYDEVRRREFRAFAQSFKWPLVLAWLDAHKNRR